MALGQYGTLIGGMAGVSLLLHLVSAGNFRPDDEVWLISNVFWYIHYWLNTCARLALFCSVVLIGMEIYMPNTITSYTSIRTSDLAKYLTKLLAASAICMLVRFVMPGPVTSFGFLYKLGFIFSLSSTALSIVETTGGPGRRGFSRTSFRSPSRTDSEKSSEDDDKRRLGNSSQNVQTSLRAR